MNAVKQMIERNVVVHEVEGIAFECDRWTFQKSLETFGPGAFDLVKTDDGNQVMKLNPKKLKDNEATRDKVLVAVMRNPAIGDKDDEAGGVITLRTMGDLKWGLFNAIVGRDVEKAGNFPESSEDQAEPTSPSS